MATTPVTTRSSQRAVMLPGNQLWRLRKADRAKFQSTSRPGPTSSTMSAMSGSSKGRLNVPVKVADDTAGEVGFPSGYRGSLQRVIAVPALAHAVLMDPELNPAQRAVLLGTVRNAAATGNLSTPGLVGAAIGAGAGIAVGVTVGKLLGAMINLPPQVQQTIATVGGIAGLLNASGAF